MDILYGCIIFCSCWNFKFQSSFKTSLTSVSLQPNEVLFSPFADENLEVQEGKVTMQVWLEVGQRYAFEFSSSKGNTLDSLSNSTASFFFHILYPVQWSLFLRELSQIFNFLKSSPWKANRSNTARADWQTLYYAVVWDKHEVKR